MTPLFPSQPGVVGVFYDQQVMPITIYVVSTDGVIGWGTGEEMRAVLTGVDLGGAGAVAVNSTLGERIHVAVAGGERPGMIRLTGLIFGAVCRSNLISSGPNGLTRVLEFYEAVRVSTSGRTVRVVLGGFLVLTGVVTAFQERVVDPNTGLGEFSIDIPYFPRRFLGSPGQSSPSLNGPALAGALR